MINFLKSINLEQYINIFEKESISIETLQDWEDEDLIDLGLKKPHIRTIRRNTQESTQNTSTLIHSNKFDEASKSFETITAKDSRRKIFFSYGHDRHAALIQRIRDDLQKNGFDIWMDDQGLKTKDYWSYKIEAAIENATEVIYFITPHSARRPDGYCLKELRYALDCGKEITPIMLDYYKLPIDINLLQWMDLQPLANSFNKNIYNKFIYEISEVINGNKILDGSDKQVNFLQLLKPLDFSYDIKKHIGNFIGRKWLYDKVNSFTTEYKNIFWITAEAGFGKTAFSTYLMTKHPNAIGIHFCDYKSKNRKKSTNVLRTLIYQLTTQIKEYKTLLEYSYLEKLNEITTMTSIDITRELLISPLNKIEVSENYFFIIDALDEANENGNNELIDVIQIFSDLPSWLKIIITSRPEAYFKRKLSKLDILYLNANSTENFKDLKFFIIESFKKSIFNHIVDNNTVEQLLVKSEGNILYIKEVFEGIKYKQITIKDLDSLPKGMNGLYFNMFERYFHNFDAYEKKYLPLINILVAFKNGLSISLIMSILDINKLTYDKLKEAFYSILEENNEIVTFYHKSLFDWLSDYNTSGIFCADTENGHHRIYTYFKQKLKHSSLNDLSYSELDIFTKSVKYLNEESTIFEKDLLSYLLLKNENPDYIFEEDTKINNLYTLYGTKAYECVIFQLSKAKNNIKTDSLTELDIFYFFALLVKVSKISDSRIDTYIKENLSKALYSLLNFLSSTNQNSLYLKRLSKFIAQIHKKINFHQLLECRVLFISTFIDFVKEREIFEEVIFPYIKKYAIKEGINIEYIVPGYGISETFYLKQSFIEDHIKSIKNTIQKYQTFSISLLGQRYGWIPLPYQIDKLLFEDILYHNDIEKRSLLLEWYMLDSNTIPNSYTLKPRVNQTINPDIWTPIEDKLREAINYNAMSNPSGIKLLSSTNFEVNAISKYQNIHNRLCIIKDIVEPEGATQVFFKNECLNKFKHLLRLKCNNIDDVNYYETYTENTISYLKEWVHYLHKTKKVLTPLEKELLEQSKFMLYKLINFFGREEELEMILKYIESTNIQPFLITGEAASGKSSLLAKSITRVEAKKSFKLIYRFIDGSTYSSFLEDMLLSIFEELHIDIKIKSKEENIEEFYHRISIALKNISEDVIIFLDSIDKLDNLMWLPISLPTNLKIIISLTKKDSSFHYEFIQSKLNYKNILYLNTPNKIEIKQVLSNLLLSESRSLTNFQFDFVLKHILESSYPYIYLKIAFEEIKTWKSSTLHITLPNSLEEMFVQYLKYLNSIGHSSTIVNRLLSYLIASEHGLSEEDIIVLLNNDKEILDESNKNNMYAINNSLPYSIINRLLLDLQPFLKETMINGEKLINIEQKLIYKIIFEEIYIKQKIYIHTKLVNYFLKSK